MALPGRYRPAGDGDGREWCGGLAGNLYPLGGIAEVNVDTAALSTQELRFPGQWFQAETGLHQNWHRDYDPTTGRYLQPDPLGLIDGPSVYGYALQSPMRYTDPTGLAAEGAAGCLFGPAGCAAGAVYSACKAVIVIGVVVYKIFSEDCSGDCNHVVNNDSQPEKPHKGETPDDKPQDFRPHEGSGDKEKISDGSIWSPDHAGHGGSKWKRWPSKRHKGQRKGRESVRPDGSVR